MVDSQPAALERLDDIELATIARWGGPAANRAFGALARRHQAWLVRLLLYLLGGTAGAEDAAQETFVRAFLAIGQFRGEASFRTWLRVIASRIAFNRRRDTATRERYIEQIRPRTAPDAAGGLEARQVLQQTLARLSYPYREILVLRYVDELPVAEIAQVLDLGVSAAKMRLLRAREQFQQEYADLTGEGHQQHQSEAS